MFPFGVGAEPPARDAAPPCRWHGFTEELCWGPAACVCHSHVTARFGLACASRDTAEGRTRLCVPVRCRGRSRCRFPSCGEPRHQQDCPELGRENNSKEIFTRQLLAEACCGKSRSRCCTQPSMKNSSREGLRERERAVAVARFLLCRGDQEVHLASPNTGDRRSQTGWRVRMRLDGWEILGMRGSDGAAGARLLCAG